MRCRSPTPHHPLRGTALRPRRLRRAASPQERCHRDRKRNRRPRSRVRSRQPASRRSVSDRQRSEARSGSASRLRPWRWPGPPTPVSGAPAFPDRPPSRSEEEPPQARCGPRRSSGPLERSTQLLRTPRQDRPPSTSDRRAWPPRPMLRTTRRWRESEPRELPRWRRSRMSGRNGRRRRTWERAKGRAEG